MTNATVIRTFTDVETGRPVGHNGDCWVLYPLHPGQYEERAFQPIDPMTIVYRCAVPIRPEMRVLDYTLKQEAHDLEHQLLVALSEELERRAAAGQPWITGTDIRRLAGTMAPIVEFLDIWGSTDEEQFYANRALARAWHEFVAYHASV